MSFRGVKRAECRGRVHQEEIRRHKGGQLEVIANGKGSSAMSIASSHAGAERSTTRCLKMTLGPSLTFANHSIFSHPLSSSRLDKRESADPALHTARESSCALVSMQHLLTQRRAEILAALRDDPGAVAAPAALALRNATGPAHRFFSA